MGFSSEGGMEPYRQARDASSAAQRKGHPTSNMIAAEPPHLTTASSNTSTHQFPPRAPRNIETVVLGNLSFETWYHSPYPDSLILTPEQATAANRSRAVYDGDIVNGTYSAPSPSSNSINSVTCPQLHVCPYCFRYTPERSAYIAHLRYHEYFKKQNPDTLPVPESGLKIYEHDGYKVWQIRGEEEKLYCQNLSLFGKLFLDQKSVYFDVGGFWYYVLTYTPPEGSSKSRKSRGGHKRGSSHSGDDLGLETQVLGFFSKEYLSWDANNLACILVFPPFQHRQLGKMLMSVSYKLSAWEWETGVPGGPEKPLSEMGRRSYIRFWSERVARFMLGQSADADGNKVFENVKRRKTGPRKEEMTVKEIAERTGMLAEDVIAALGEMGICELVVPKKKKKKSEEANGVPASGTEEDKMANMIVQQSKVRDWVDRNIVELQDPVREEGFLGEWAWTGSGEEESEMGDGESGSE